MSFDQDEYLTELQRRIKEHSASVRRMPDKELKVVYERMHDNPGKYDSALMTACYREVERRSIAASWFWKRWLNRREYADWKSFMERIEAKAMRSALDVITKHKGET